MATLFTVKGAYKTIKPKNGKMFTLEELQEYVGGYIETQTSRDGQRIFVMNEDGKLMNLPINYPATVQYRKLHGGCDFLVGDVLLLWSNEIE